MIFNKYIISSCDLGLWLLILIIIPLVLYIIVLRRRLLLFTKKRSISTTTDELKKLFTGEEPQSVVKIKKSGRDSAKRFEMVTVLFSDIQGFTKIAEELNPESLIDELDDFFYHFDSVVEKLNIEKIKTIGDAYMCAGGIPNENRTNPIDVVMAALEMQEFMKHMKHKKGEMWDLRIGIHTGSVIAGMVGHKKISYDIWGDTVNTASRMESSCTPGKINVSGQTYEYVKDYFICEYRGKMPVKYKGNIDMYYVTGIKPELSNKIQGLPIRYIDLKLQMLRLFDLESYILQQFEKYANPDITFHNLKNAIDIYSHTELFARSEDVEVQQMIILLTAALIKNSGYLVNYENHLNETIKFTKNILPKFFYLPDQIEKICNLLAFTEENRSPNNKLEMIFSDALTSYIGRVDFEEVIQAQYKEQKSFENKKTGEWREEQIEFVKNHRFYTKAALALREVKPDYQLNKLQNMKI